MKKKIFACILFYLFLSGDAMAGGAGEGGFASHGIDASRLQSIRNIGKAVLQARRHGRDASQFRKDKETLESLRNTLHALRNGMMEQRGDATITPEAYAPPLKYIKETDVEPSAKKGVEGQSKATDDGIDSKIQSAASKITSLENSYRTQSPEESFVERSYRRIAGIEDAPVSEKQKNDALKASKISAFSRRLGEIAGLPESERLNELNNLIRRAEKKPATYNIGIAPTIGMRPGHGQEVRR